MQPSQKEERKSLTAYAYAIFRLSRAVDCNASLRECIKSLTHPKAQIVPERSGYKGRSTQRGIIRWPNASSEPTQITDRFKGVQLNISSITQREFNQIKQATNRKVYFRGFPLDAIEDEVNDLFSQFGTIEFIYFMNESKAGKRTNRQGYLIFEHRQSLENLLQSCSVFWCRGKKIHFEEYNTGNEKVDSGTKNIPHPELPPQIQKSKEGLSLQHRDKPYKQNHPFSHEIFNVQGPTNASTLYSQEYRANIGNVHLNLLDPNNIRINLLAPSSLIPRHLPKRPPWKPQAE